MVAGKELNWYSCISNMSRKNYFKVHSFYAKSGNGNKICQFGNQSHDQNYNI
jgi:hypothetical protein